LSNFITNGASVLPGVKTDARSPTGASDTWDASDSNELRQAALDLRAEAISEQALRLAADAAIIASGATPANVGLAPITPTGSAVTQSVNDWMSRFNPGVIATGSTTPRTSEARAADVVNVKDHGATGDGNTDDTAAINAAIDEGVATGRAVYFPGGTYKVIPATASTTAGPAALMVCFLLRSNMHLFANGDVTLRLADAVSSDVAPLNVSMFHTPTNVSGLSFRGLIMDMNGANNPISPSRPVSYQTGFNMAMIGASGANARADYVVIENCVFKNTPGTNCIVAGQTTAGHAAVLGLHWVIRNNLFIDNGLDTSDFTAVFAWIDDCLCDGNRFLSSTPYRTVGLTGSQTGYEIHGSNHQLTNNFVQNYFRGMYISSNYTSATNNSVIANNVFDSVFVGIDLMRGDLCPPLGGVIIANNVFRFDDYAFAGFSSLKWAIKIDDNYVLTDINVQGNIANKTGVNIGSCFFWASVSAGFAGTGGVEGLRILDNSVHGFSQGIQIRALKAANEFGYCEISRNYFYQLSDAGTATSLGVAANATGTIRTLVIDQNRFVDERVPPSTVYGILIGDGTVTDLWLGANLFKGITAPYVESAVAITNRSGPGISDTGVNAPRIRTSISGDRGDNAQTLTVGIDQDIQRWAASLTADKVVTLSTLGALRGDHFRIVRTSSGAFNLDVGGLKMLVAPGGGTQGTWCDVTFNGTAWELTGYGTL
jgi:hypothetical protein